jgi:ParB family chromosome partitioning protein
MRFRDRLALLGGEDLRQVFLVRHHQVEPFAKDDSALFRGLRAPGGKRGVRRLDRAARLRGAHVGHGAEDFAGGGVVDGNRLAAVGVGPSSVDVALLAKERRVLEVECGDAGNLGVVHGKLR